VEHRGVEYQVVQTIVGDFRWTVKLGGREKFGVHPRRDSAIALAKKLIDQHAPKHTADIGVDERRTLAATAV
jgi:hypothetical protein